MLKETIQRRNELIIELARHVPLGEFCNVMEELKYQIMYDGELEYITNIDELKKLLKGGLT